MGFCPNSGRCIRPVLPRWGCLDSYRYPGRAAFAFANVRPRNHHPLMWRRRLLVFSLASLGGGVGMSLGGCAKPKDLPEITIRASTAGELAAFRSEFTARFTPEQVSPLDTALQELQLDAMNRNVPTAEAREQDMLSAVNGKSVHEAQVLGWQARRHRLLREITFMSGQVAHNLRLQQQTAATGTPESVLTHLHNAQDILVRLQRDLAAADRRLIEWGARLDPVAPAITEQKPSSP
jgi:hypothetical protein